MKRSPPNCASRKRSCAPRPQRNNSLRHSGASRSDELWSAPCAPENLEIPRCAIAHPRSGPSDHPGMTPSSEQRTPTMRFMMLMIPLGYETASPDVQLDPERVKAMMKYNEELKEAGVLI